MGRKNIFLEKVWASFYSGVALCMIFGSYGVGAVDEELLEDSPMSPQISFLTEEDIQTILLTIEEEEQPSFIEFITQFMRQVPRLHVEDMLNEFSAVEINHRELFMYNLGLLIDPRLEEVGTSRLQMMRILRPFNPEEQADFSFYAQRFMTESMSESLRAEILGEFEHIPAFEREGFAEAMQRFFIPGVSDAWRRTVIQNMVGIGTYDRRNAFFRTVMDSLEEYENPDPHQIMEHINRHFQVYDAERRNQEIDLENVEYADQYARNNKALRIVWELTDPLLFPAAQEDFSEDVGADTLFSLRYLFQDKKDPALQEIKEFLIDLLSHPYVDAAFSSLYDSSRTGYIEIENALYTLEGEIEGEDFGPIVNGGIYRPAGEEYFAASIPEIFARIWIAIMTYESKKEGGQLDREQTEKSRENMLLSFVQGLAESVEDDGHRVCHNGKITRALSALQGYYPEIVITPLEEELSTNQLLKLLSLRAFGVGDCPIITRQQFDRFVEDFKTQYYEGQEETQRFQEFQEGVQELLNLWPENLGAFEPKSPV